jgi:hypothetical protein
MPWTEAAEPQPGRIVDFFDHVNQAFDAACRRAGRHDRHLRVAGEHVTLAFAGPALIDSLAPALAHLTSDVAGGGLRVCLWDATSTGISPPPPLLTADNYYGNGEVRGAASGDVRIAFDAYLGALSAFDASQRVAFFWIRDARHVPVTFVGTPLRIIFQWWADRHDRVLIHAAAIGCDGRGAAIVGPSGAGKSTTALAALDGGLDYAGDDFVLVEPDPDPRVHGLYCSAKIDDRTLATRFPHLAGALADRPRLPAEKHVLFVHPRWRGRMASTLALRVLLLPAFAEGPASALTPIGHGEALRALVPGLFPFPGMRQTAVGRLARLVRRLPAYRLDLGTDLEGVAAALRAALAAGARS